jgi:hypothetical protein
MPISKHTYETQGYYGSEHMPCNIFVCEMSDGSRWYAVEDSINVNRTYEDIELGTNVEDLNDFDTFTASTPIESEEILLSQVDS